MLRESKAVIDSIVGVDSGSWSTGSLANDGCIYYISSYQQPHKLLKLDPMNIGCTSIIPYKDNGSKIRCNYYGCVFHPLDGCIYGVPFEANRILKFNPVTKKVTFVGQKLTEDALYKYTSAVVGLDGRMYFIPFQASRILCWDTENEIMSYVASNQPAGYWKGAVVGQNGCLYCIPFDARQVLKYNPHDQSTKLIGSKYEGNCKWHSGVLGKDGLTIYGVPYSHDRILKVDIINNTTSLVGANVGKELAKWTSGVLGADHNVYMTPHNAEHVLKYDTITCSTSYVSLDKIVRGGLTHRCNGGVVAEDGYIYMIPNSGRSEQVIKIRSWNEWFYLRLRLLVQMRRADPLTSENQDLMIAQHHIIHTNDDIFRFVLEFIS